MAEITCKNGCGHTEIWSHSAMAKHERKCTVVAKAEFTPEEVKVFKEIERAANHLSDAKASHDNINGQTFKSAVIAGQEALANAQEAFDKAWGMLTPEVAIRFGKWRKAMAIQGRTSADKLRRM